ncbi:sperm-associated antigen 8 isoform X2 [Nannospalax galili]|uniref:sperm-associated antigen 8 isoform X2 n=1 Tax=Nannospalax galili TaxID=1026970 RepID=UPI000819F971|nr:sperm-associated antigen 8 isoform X2 [Nannospalax galili]
METNESEGSRARSLDVLPSSEGLETTSEPISSSDGGPRSGLEAITSADALCTKSPEPCSVLTDPSSASLVEATCSGSHQRGHGRFGFQPLYVSYIARNPCPTSDLSSTPVPASSDPGHSSVASSGPVSGSLLSCCPGLGSKPGKGSDPAPRAGPASGPGHKVNSSTPQRFRSLPPDLPPDSNSWIHHCQWEPQNQSWKPLQVTEPGARGPWKPPVAERKPEFLCETLPRGQCLLYNWEEERATNHLDHIPRLQDGSESFFFRHGHQGLLSMQLQSPMPSSTTHKDSYQPPRNIGQPLRGKREAMLEMLLHHQICKEVRAEQEPTKKLFEAESVTHRDYQIELVEAGPPAPTKGVNNIRTLDTPFRKNCSFSTPVPLSLGQPFPYEPENFSHRMEVMSSLACQEGGQRCGGERTTPV